jgi:hypothetical protein
LLVAGLGFTTVAESAWAHGVGVVALLAFAAVAFPAALPPEALEAEASRDTREDGPPRA